MPIIERDPSAAAGQRYDLIIIGGGIYGVMLALESARLGVRPLLLEQDDFGGATSFNSLRILHGGFRYLQSANLARFHVSVQERSWFLRTFPGLTHPAPFLMPLYGDGLRKPGVLRAALMLNHILSWQRNHGLAVDKRLPKGEVFSPDEVQRLFPGVDAQGLRGGVVWFDVCMPDSQRVLMEALRWACGLGAVALNHVRAGELLQSSGEVRGVRAEDKNTGQFLDYSSGIVINAAGPWSRGLARQYHQAGGDGFSTLFRPSLAWNVLLDKEPLSSHGLAVTPRKPGARTYFLVPWKGRMLAGTGHAPWSGNEADPCPSRDQMEAFLADLNSAVPDLRLEQKHVARVLPGLLPTIREGSCELEDKPVILDHGQQHGPKGLFSVSGVKFTTARHVAETALRRVRRSGMLSEAGRTSGAMSSPPGTFRLPSADASGQQWQDALRILAAKEAVVHLDDLFLRRTNLWHEPSRVLELAPAALKLFAWDTSRQEEEMSRLCQALWPRSSCTDKEPLVP